MYKNTYHLCTTALKDTVLCRDNEDYIYLWNSLAIYAASVGVQIYCLILMSNHLHILLRAPREKIEIFFTFVKTRMCRYLKKKYGQVRVPKWEYKLFGINDRKAFCQEVAYILRNAL